MGAPAARADDWADCQSKTVGQIISGCTSVIQKGGRNVREMVQAYRLRAGVYEAQGNASLPSRICARPLKFHPSMCLTG